MFNIDVLSDLHDRFGVKDRLDFMANDPADHLLITGDLTENGDLKEYQRMGDWLAPWGGCLTVVPGNHDAGLAGNLYQQIRLDRFDREFGTNFLGWNDPSVTELGKLSASKAVIIGLDSNRETWWPGDFARGRIGWYQRWCLLQLLIKYRGWVRIVALHHHPFYRHPFMCLTDSEKLMKILAGRCEVLCFGHKHRQERCTEQEKRYRIPCILASGASYKERTAWRIRIFETRFGGMVLAGLVPIIKD